jgi:hypothetical protein
VGETITIPSDFPGASGKMKDDQDLVEKREFLRIPVKGFRGLAT